MVPDINILSTVLSTAVETDALARKDTPEVPVIDVTALLHSILPSMLTVPVPAMIDDAVPVVAVATALVNFNLAESVIENIL